MPSEKQLKYWESLKVNGAWNKDKKLLNPSQNQLAYWESLKGKTHKGKKGQIPWNKKYTTEMVECACGCGREFNKNDTKNRRRNSKYYSLECYWKSKKGGIPWNKGQRGQYKTSEKTKEKLKIATLKSWENEENREKRIKSMRKWLLKNPHKGKPHTEGAKEKIRIASLKCWQNKEGKEQRIKNMMKALVKRPTSLEKQMIDIIKRNNLPYKYVGDGSFIIGYKNPDFVNINSEKKLIEVGNVYHHQNDYESKRRRYFAKFGWESYIFIMNDLNEKTILETLKGG